MTVHLPDGDTQINARFEEGADLVVEDESQIPFRLIRNLGCGHSGIVEEVQHVDTGLGYARKKMAIRGKRLKQEKIRIFQNEVKIIRGLGKHHHIIRVFATYMAKREVGLILSPVAREGDLGHFLEIVDEIRSKDPSHPRLDEMLPTLDRAFGCLASGLQFMHGKRIRHKDIKPQNILVHCGSVIYTDFGYSLDCTPFSNSTTEGQPDSLTRRYSAPEVKANEERNSSSDVFSLGCVFAEMISARTDNDELYPDHEFSQCLASVHNSLLKPTISELPQLLYRITRSMLDEERSKRPRAGEIFYELVDCPDLCCPTCRLTQVVRTVPDDGALQSSTIASCLQILDEGNGLSDSYTEEDDPRKSQDLVHLPKNKEVSVDLCADESEPESSAGPEPDIPLDIMNQLEESARFDSLSSWLEQHSESLIENATFKMPRMKDLYDRYFSVKDKRFFVQGRAFSALLRQSDFIMNGHSQNAHTSSNVEEYYFIAIGKNRDSCRVVPIFSYSRKVTTRATMQLQKGILVYSHGFEPQYYPGDDDVRHVNPRSPICVEMKPGVRPFQPSTRIYFNLPQTVKFSTKVREIGRVHQPCLDQCLEYWNNPGITDAIPVYVTSSFGLRQHLSLVSYPKYISGGDKKSYGEQTDSDDDDYSREYYDK